MGVSIPSSYTITLDGGSPLDVDLTIPTQFTIGISTLPKIQLGVDPLDLNIRLKELPSIRGHLPADFKICLALLGVELLTVRLCGEAQIITEPYVANPCEICGGQGRDTLGSTIELTGVPAPQTAGAAATGAA